MKKHIFHLAWSPESLPTVDAISPLLDFLNARLQDYNGRLLKGNVVRCLHIMWESVLNEIEDHVEANTSVSNWILYYNLPAEAASFSSNEIVFNPRSKTPSFTTVYTKHCICWSTFSPLMARASPEPNF